MSSSDLKFGTSGLRGLSTVLDGRPAVSFSHAFVRVMIDQGRLPQGGSILIGRDLRASSPSIARYCMAGIRQAGAEPVDCGALPTPALAAHAMKLGAPAIMVTGSHIPDDRNGLKFYRPDGEIDKHDEAAVLEAEASQPEALIVEQADAAGTDADATAGYVDRALAMLAPDALAGMRVGVYQHSSVMRDMLTDVLARLGAETVSFGHSDTFVPVDTEALRPEDAELCRAAVRKYGLDAIVSTDGDADRPLIADAAGEFVRGDLVGAVTAAMLGADCVVTPITSNSGIERSGRFARVMRTRIGSPCVIEGMRIAATEGAATVVGFEANGGVLLGTNAEIAGRRVSALPTRDAMLPILAVLWAVKSAGKQLSSFADEFAFGAALADRLQNVPADRSAPFLAAMDGDANFRETFLAGLIEVAAFDTTDGVRMIGTDGSVLHYRASGNAPELRCYVEARSAEQAAALLAEGLARARKHLASE
ncbi:MAG: phosphomannomutase [Rhizobiaceae bacterium]